jgi:ATP-binding protein involved in chromosome partitioning
MSSNAALAILEPAATRVRDPLSGRSVWLAQMIDQPILDGDTLSFTLRAQPGHDSAALSRMEETLIRQIAETGFQGEVRCKVRPAQAAETEPEPAPKEDPVPGMSGGGMQPHGGPLVKAVVPGVKRIVAVASGKGGVGKSTVATNLAVAMSQAGLRVGLMDADVYGPSLPTMLNVQGRPLANADKHIIPLEAYGIKIMSMGFLVPETQAIIWRGPMVMGAVRQFLHQVCWGELDVLLIDLPPGTGDAQLTMIQTVDIAGAVVVTTPQKVATIDAVRGIEMFRKLEVPVLGIVENMSWMDMPDGSRTHPFGDGGGAATAAQFDVPLLAQVPFDSRICAGGDAGIPAATRDDGPGEVFTGIAKAVATALSLG